jgi:hypothetical protein
MSKTPRTDARELAISMQNEDSCCAIYVKIDGKEYEGGLVDTDFARELECENARLNNRINNLLLPMQHRLIERNERLREALEAAWYAMERHAPQLCRREAATARQILENCGRLPTLSHEPKN